MRLIHHGVLSHRGAPGSVLSAETAEHHRRELALLVIIFILRGILAGTLGLTFDEAYYFQWGQHPALSYLDHPPLLAWVLIPVVDWAPPSAFPSRLPLLLLSLLFSWFTFTSCKAGWGVRVAWRATVLVNALPSVSLSFIFIAPDGPLLAFWMASLWSLQRALRSDRLVHWMLAGVMVGLALLSKYLAFLLFPSWGLMLLVAYPRRVRTLGPWLALLISLTVFLPVVVWNAQRDWVSFRFQLSMGPRHGDDVSGVLSLLDFVGGQAAAVTPWMLVAVLMAFKRTGAAFVSRQSAPWVFCSGIPLMVFLVLAWRHPLEVNWVTCAWLSAAPLVVVHCPKLVPWVTGGGMAVLVVVTGYVQHPLLPPKNDFVARGEGWASVASAVRHCADENGVSDVVVLGHKRYEVSQLQFHLNKEFPVRPAHPQQRFDFLPQVNAPNAILVVRPEEAEEGLLAEIANIHGYAGARLCSEISRRRPTGESVEEFRLYFLE